MSYYEEDKRYEKVSKDHGVWVRFKSYSTFAKWKKRAIAKNYYFTDRVPKKKGGYYYLLVVKEAYLKDRYKKRRKR